MTFLEQLPNNSIIVTHGNFIVHAADAAANIGTITDASDWDGQIRPSSLTFIDQGQIMYIGKTIE